MNNLKIFTENIEPEAINQIYTLIKQEVFKDCKVRIKEIVAIMDLETSSTSKITREFLKKMQKNGKGIGFAVYMDEISRLCERKGAEV